MSVFCIKLAEIPLEVHAQFDSTRDFCKEYLTEDAPLFSVAPAQADIEKMRRSDHETALAEWRTPAEQTDSYLETLALCHAVMEELIRYNVLLFHGSVIAHSGKAYLFTARSGTGKTTHSRLWLRNLPESHILNGDKPLLIFKNGRIYACGSPWRGKEKYGRNEILPLEAACILERDTENHIEKIAIKDSFDVLMKQCHIPEGNDNLSTSVKLIRQFSALRLYRLGCNMEDEAVLVSYGGMVMNEKNFEEVLDENGSLFFKSVGCSMCPLFREGKDFICIAKRPEGGLKKYDAVLFRRPEIAGRGRYILHRILKINPDGSYWIVGDNCVTGETIRDENILGVLTAVRRNGRTIKISDLGYKLYV